MTKQENQEPMNQMVDMEDLTIGELPQNEVKGGAGTLTKAGGGTLILNNTNTY
jgi:hypothetical protein